MNKKSKTLLKKILFICCSVFVVAISCLIGILLGRSGSGIETEIDIGNNIVKSNKAIGIYHTYNWSEGTEATIFLNDDSTCKYLDYEGCTWNINGRDISLSYVGYRAYQITKRDNYFTYTNKAECEKNYIKEYFTCEPYDRTTNLTLVDNGILLGDVLFDKIG